jgi:hypothetical protein
MNLISVSSVLRFEGVGILTVIAQSLEMFWLIGQAINFEKRGIQRVAAACNSCQISPQGRHKDADSGAGFYRLALSLTRPDRAIGIRASARVDELQQASDNPNFSAVNKNLLPWL